MKLHTRAVLSLITAAAAATGLVSCSTENSLKTASENTPAPAEDAYPLTVCVVSGEPLGSMGDPYVHIHEGTTVKFCCGGCLDKFNENPDLYVAKIKDAEPGS